MPMTMIYYTAGNREEALRIGRALVEEKLAACINVLGEITSIYPWKGAIEEDQEVAAIAKTSAENTQRVIDRVKELHSYECPCAIAWPIAEGNSAYLGWLSDVLKRED